MGAQESALISWDEAARDWPGLIVLVGLTYLKSDESFDRQEQFYGQIVGVDENAGIELDLSGQWAGERYWLPPQLEAFEIAAKGDYKLRSTGELVRDPDLISTWTIKVPADA